MKIVNTLLAIGIISFLLSCCTNNPHGPITSPSEMISSPSQTSTILVFPSRTPTDTSIPAAFFTPTTTLVPTLSTGDATTKLINYLSNNGNCRLPCIWGITPGQTTARNAMNILLPFSGLSLESDFNIFNNTYGVIMPQYTKGNVNITIGISYLLTNDLVTETSFYANPGNNGFVTIYGSKEFNIDLSYYLLTNILQEYGRPSSVLLENERGGGMFHLLLLFPDQGIAVEYYTQGINSGNIDLGCPSKFLFALVLLPAGNPDSFNQYIQKYFADVFPSNKSLTEATFLSIDNFYKIYQKPTSQCIATPISIWPTSVPR